MSVFLVLCIGRVYLPLYCPNTFNIWNLNTPSERIKNIFQTQR